MCIPSRVASLNIPACTQISPVGNEEILLTTNIPNVPPNPALPCTKCGLYPHPVNSIQKLDPELQLAMPIIDRHSPISTSISAQPSETVKKRRIVLDGRVINSAEIIEQLKEKQKSRPIKHTKKVNSTFVVFPCNTNGLTQYNMEWYR